MGDGKGKSLLKVAGSKMEEKAKPTAGDLLRDPAVVTEALKVGGKMIETFKSWNELKKARVVSEAKIHEWDKRLEVARVEFQKSQHTHDTEVQKLEDRRGSLAPLQELLREIVQEATSSDLSREQKKELRAEVLEVGKVLVNLHGK